MSEGREGWDEYAPFYDWENARTLGRRDVPFWRAIGEGANGDVLELGCGTGRIALPLARAGVRIAGIDRSKPMLDQASRRAGGRLPLVRGDIRWLPFRSGAFGAVLAPYGILQSQEGHSSDAVESVRQDRRRRRTTFEQQFLERRGRQTLEHSFTLTFGTWSVSEMARRLEESGFKVKAVLGDYAGRPLERARRRVDYPCGKGVRFSVRSR